VLRTSLYLRRRYHAYVSPTTIFKIFRRHHVGRVSLKKYGPGPKPADAPLAVPGHSVQLDVKFVSRGTDIWRIYDSRLSLSDNDLDFRGAGALDAVRHCGHHVEVRRSDLYGVIGKAQC